MPKPWPHKNGSYNFNFNSCWPSTVQTTQPPSATSIPSTLSTPTLFHSLPLR
ncbi:hypothetical protein GBA52_017749 [Prunus armeniaca]|nr:hypothetical protein GBA52_017749 [Prunus armeniaca]